MYSKEIDDLIKLREYVLEYKEYFKICDSTQVDHVKYEKEAYDYNYNLWTTDNYYWKIKVKRDVNNEI